MYSDTAFVLVIILLGLVLCAILWAFGVLWEVCIVGSILSIPGVIAVVSYLIKTMQKREKKFDM